MKVLYIDNFAVASKSRSVAEQGIQSMLDTLRGRGVRCEKDAEVTSGAELLGFTPSTRGPRCGGPPLAEPMAPRSTALDTALARARQSEVLIVGRAAGFREAQRDAIEGARWRAVLCGRWRRREATHGLEGAAHSLALRRLARTALHHGRYRVGPSGR